MKQKRQKRAERHPERGMSLFMVAASVVVLLITAALAIDLASLYVARNEAQRAADAAALAGAKKIVESGYPSGLVTQATAQTLAAQEAITVGAQNTVGGQPADIQPGDLTFDFSVPQNPRITVGVQRTAARGNPLPLFFARVLGVLTADVGAVATAEAYSPSGSTGGPTFCAGCIKPIVLPNCDPTHLNSPPNPFCPPGYSKYVDPTCVANPSFPSICHPGSVASGGVIGSLLTIRPGAPSDAPAPSQYYSLDIECLGGGADYRNDIITCNQSLFACGSTLCLETGRMVGPTTQGFRDLIHWPGQDTIDTSSGPPFAITGGSNNPNPVLRGQVISTSDSIVTIPIYDGHELCPGGSCGFQVQIIGYLQMFVIDITGAAEVTGVVLNIAGCGTAGPGPGGNACGTGGSGSGTISGGGASMLPVRLVRNPGT